ncbi:MAG TPA: hypothetical protein VN419_05645 [Humidesulfovibrio sp.]|uniref:hypothetical protein n=1 Tax=Humidesulfovibrio sp. TaxID=2910988 RepID=UPI002BCA84E3|nr:hypothetical protein [Humidesulfovibrio sp.]HWR03483.1 hypothetical protein [Humidesulfovibrio sp.]
MTIAPGARAALAAEKKDLMSAQRVSPAGLGARVLLAAIWFLLAGLCQPAQTRAEAVRVSASADAGLSQTQARQQALDRALVDAVNREARNMLPVPATEARLKALRDHLAPHALDYVQSYHEITAGQQAPAQPDQKSGQQADPQAASSVAQKAPGASFEVELDVTVNRVYLRQTLVRLGLFAGAEHPRVFVLRLGSGVSEKDAKGFDAANTLLGLARTQQNPAGAAPEVTLERLPQGYYKAVLRQTAPSGPKVIAADSSDLATLWFDVWGKYFTEAERQAGPGLQRLAVAGFANVDAVLEFYQLLSSWTDALQDAKLAVVGFGAEGVNAQITCRVTSQQRLDAHLRPVLLERKLTLTGQSGQNGQGQTGTDAP